MTATNHALTGAVIGLAIKQPALSLPIAFLSHFVVDSIPHWSMSEKYVFKRRFNIYLSIDALVCIIMASYVALNFQNGLIVAICMFLATSPDFMWAYHRLYKEKIRGLKRNYGPIARFHARIQDASHPKHGHQLRGAFIEVIWFAAMIWLITILK